MRPSRGVRAVDAAVGRWRTSRWAASGDGPAATTGRPGITKFLRARVLWPVGWRWWLVAFSPVVFLGIAVVGSLMSGASLPGLAGFGLVSGLPEVGLLAVFALVINLVLAVVLTPVFEAIGARRGQDATSPADYDEEVALPKEPAPEALG